VYSSIEVASFSGWRLLGSPVVTRNLSAFLLYVSMGSSHLRNRTAMVASREISCASEPFRAKMVIVSGATRLLIQTPINTHAITSVTTPTFRRQP
jgi:hypothetical protein